MEKIVTRKYNARNGSIIVENEVVVKESVFLGDEDVTKVECGLYSNENKELLPVIYDYLWIGNTKETEDYVTLKKGNESFIYNCKNNQMITVNIKDAYLYMFVGKNIQFLTSSGIGIMDLNGIMEIPNIYDDINYINDKLIFVKKDNVWNIVDINGKKNSPVDLSYDDIGGLEDDLFMVSKNDKYGFIDILGNEVIPCIYDYINNFYDGHAVVGIIYSKNPRTTFRDDNTIIDYYEESYKYGVINKNNDIVIPITHLKNDEKIEEYFKPKVKIIC